MESSAVGMTGRGDPDVKGVAQDAHWIERDQRLRVAIHFCAGLGSDCLSSPMPLHGSF